MRAVHVDPPEDRGERDGLAYSLFLPPGAPLGGVVILHGADSSQESHWDFARRLRAHGLAAATFDQRGHGATGGALDGRMAADVATIAGLLPAGVPVGLRGSSMGGYLALVAAKAVNARGVVAICPASADGLRRGVRTGRLGFAATPGLDAFLTEHDEQAAAIALAAPVLLLHAEGDEVVPVAQSAAIAAAREEAARPTRFVRVPGGHHRSIQHDAEFQDLSVRFLLRAFGAR